MITVIGNIAGVLAVFVGLTICGMIYADMLHDLQEAEDEEEIEQLEDAA